jgi:hypothetical protein
VKQQKQFKHVRIRNGCLSVTIPVGIPNMVPMLRQQLQDALIMARVSGIPKNSLAKFEMALGDQLDLLAKDVEKYLKEVEAAEVDPEMPSEQHDTTVFDRGELIVDDGAKILSQILDLTRLTNSHLHGEARLVQPSEIELDKGSKKQ